MSKPKALPANHPIQPNHINTKKHFFDAFGNMETEISANYIVQLAQDKGGWGDFTEAEIEKKYNEADHVDFRFNRLLREWIIEVKSGVYRITHEFVAACFKASPATGGTVK